MTKLKLVSLVVGVGLLTCATSVRAFEWESCKAAWKESPASAVCGSVDGGPANGEATFSKAYVYRDHLHCELHTKCPISNNTDQRRDASFHGKDWQVKALKSCPTGGFHTKPRLCWQ